MNYYCYILFIPIILISSFLIFLSNSWFSIWIIIEINLIRFISLIIFDKNLKNDIIIIYFIIQSFNSYIFLIFSIILNYNDLIFGTFLLIINFSLLIKLGLPPFHLWYLKIINNLSWFNIFFISTIQKIIPLIILRILINFNYNDFLFYINLLIIIFGSIYRSLININSILIKNIYTYSSIIQISWVLILIFINELYSLNYFIIYILISLNLIYLFNLINLNRINQLIVLKFNNKKNYFLIILIMFSLRRIPPFFGFLIKWISIDIIRKSLSFILIFFIIINSLLRMFFYIRIIFNSLIIYYYRKKLNFKYINFNNKQNIKLIYLNWFILIILLIYEIF